MAKQKLDDKVLKKLDEWFARQSEPDKPLPVPAWKSYTPRKLVEEVKNQTVLGMRIYAQLEQKYKEK